MVLDWLPKIADWRERLRALGGDPAAAWTEAVAFANTRLDFVATNALDQTVRRVLGGDPPKALATKPVRLAILGSCTFAHLHGAIRVAGLRHGIHITVYEGDYGQYRQELLDRGSALHAFAPTFILFALDAHHLTSGLNAAMNAQDAAAALDEMQHNVRQCWKEARDAFHCPIIHQTPLPLHPDLLGNNEHRLPGSRAAFIERFNHALRDLADAEGVDLLSIDRRAAIDGLGAWHDPVLWHHAKQEVSLTAAPMYGELIGRLIAAKQGRSYKCLVLDLDNTVWGGVVGDDGVDGLVLGQGSSLGEAFLAVQAHARDLARRGVILAVCSKNDEANALEPFDKHPEMILRRQDIASFHANWSDKASNLQAIAAELNIGLDSLVFLDDNPVERAFIRRELPMVAVPEISDDPTTYPRTLANAGYFEALSVTEEDRIRNSQYQSNRRREELKESFADLSDYLRSLEMRLTWYRFDQLGLSRTVQLINKTNQFNLTTRRYTEDDVRAIMRDNRSFGLQLRLIDRFGDNGIISVIIGKMQDDDDLLIDTWLMSCRVLGRQVEPTTLNLVADQARRLGAKRLIGDYIPTKKNGMVKDHYAKLGFTVVETGENGASRGMLDLTRHVPAPTFIEVMEG